MEKEWQNLAENPKNWHTVSADVIQQITSTMTTVLETDVAGQREDQLKNLGWAHNDVLYANTDYEGDYRTLKAEYHTIFMKGNATEHKDCRDEEDRKCTDAYNSCDVMEMCANQHYSGIPSQCMCEVSGKSDLEVAEYLKTCMEEVSTWSDFACRDDQSLAWHKANCDTKNQQCTDQTNECAELQQDYEAMWCKWYVTIDNMCTNHVNNFNNQVDTFRASEQNLQKQMTENIEVCKAAKKIICWAGVLEETKTRQECLDYDPTPECDEFKWTAPELPDMVTCKVETLLDGVPGDEQWPMGNYNQSNKNYFTEALVLYHGDLEVVNPCPHTQNYPMYNVSQMPLGNVVIRQQGDVFTSGNCAAIKDSGIGDLCTLCEGDCYADDECGALLKDDGSYIQLRCARSWMYGQEDYYTQKGPIGCDPASLVAIAETYDGYLGVCALPGNYTCHGNEECSR